MASMITSAVMVKALLIFGGFWGGQYLDGKWGTSPYLMTLGIVLGMGMGLSWVLFTARRMR